MMFDRRLAVYFDWGLAVPVLVLCAVGLAVIRSAAGPDPDSAMQVLCVKQGMWYMAGAGIMCVTVLADYRKMDSWAYVFYIGAIAMLVGVLFFGKYAGGSRRWLALGGLRVQPSEIVKIGMVLVLARCYSRCIRTDGLGPGDLIWPAFLTLVPFCLIAMQPDLGTAMIVLLIAGSMTLFMKIEKKTFAALCAGAVGAGAGGWFFLKDYQKQRILTFLDPEHDPLGAGYHIIQSKIAIGSGMIFGKGYLRGTQNTLSFLPEQHTDFIFAVLAEEWGFAGAVFLVGVFMLLVLWGLNIAYQCRTRFGTLAALGTTSMIFWQAVINLSMVMGLVPVVGVPLPLVSYGGSSVISIMICVSILMNISMRRFVTK